MLENWDLVEKDCDSIEDLNAEIISAFKVACDELGELIGNAVIAEYNHPIAVLVNNRVRWTRELLIWLARSLSKYSVCEGFDSLIHSVKQEAKFWDAVQSIDLANAFYSAIESVEFENDLLSSGRQSDLRFVVDNRVIHLEHSVCAASDQEEKSNDILRNVLFSLLHHGGEKIHTSGRILRPFAEPRQKKVLALFKDTIDRAKLVGFAEAVKPYWYEFAASDDNNITKLEKWASERGLEVDGFSSVPYESNELHRVRCKLKWKATGGQIPHDQPGIVAIKNSRLFHRGLEEIPGIVSALEEELYDYKNIISIILMGGIPIHKVGAYAVLDSHLHIRDSLSYGNDCMIYIPNAYAEVGDSELLNNHLMSKLRHFSDWRLL